MLQPVGQSVLHGPQDRHPVEATLRPSITAAPAMIFKRLKTSMSYLPRVSRSLAAGLGDGSLPSPAWSSFRALFSDE
ncbi:MAG: hypothetical protein U0840_27940 [Gemmataceae bacterium]